MEALANLVIAAVDLAEAEGRAVHRGIIRLLVRVLALVAAAVLSGIGGLLVMLGLYLTLVRFIGHIGAALLVGGLMLVMAAVLYLYGRITPKVKRNAVPDEQIKPKPDPTSQQQGSGYDPAYTVAT
ncbi:MAG TPA: hypothetical protein VGB55_02625 [Tepidisphaeraceae bacterium]|jgi:hypothetical protein